MYTITNIKEHSHNEYFVSFRRTMSAEYSITIWLFLRTTTLRKHFFMYRRNVRLIKNKSKFHKRATNNIIKFIIYGFTARLRVFSSSITVIINCC